MAEDMEEDYEVLSTIFWALLKLLLLAVILLLCTVLALRKCPTWQRRRRLERGRGELSAYIRDKRDLAKRESVFLPPNMLHNLQGESLGESLRVLEEREGVQIVFTGEGLYKIVPPT
jgi:hypothetical protein